MWDLQVTTGRFSANEREHAMLGVPQGEHLAWRDLIHPEDWPAVHAALQLHLNLEAEPDNPLVEEDEFAKLEDPRP